MYGTVVRYRVKPGKLEDVRAWMEDSRGPNDVLGAMIVYQMDRDPNEMFVAVVSESKEAYRTFSEDPATHERYLKLMEFLDGESEWNDGTVLDAWFNL